MSGAGRIAEYLWKYPDGMPGLNEMTTEQNIFRRFYVKKSGLIFGGLLVAMMLLCAGCGNTASSGENAPTVVPVESVTISVVKTVAVESFILLQTTASPSNAVVHALSWTPSSTGVTLVSG